jgi:DNA recombination protein RmuC
VVEMIVIVAGFIAGAGLAWLGARAHFLALARVEREAFASRVATVETAQDDLRKQATERELHVSELTAQVERERTERVQSETWLAAARKSLDEQRRLIDEARERLTETFKAASADVLRENAGAFLDRARESLDAQLGQRQEAIETLIAPLRDALSRTDAEVRQLEAARQQAYGSLDQHLRTLAASSAELQRETTQLVSALRAPQVRGRWGEMTLHRVVELAGMTEHVDYAEQATVGGDGGRLRPDMVVRLPAGREIVVDAKVPLSGYLDALQAPTEDERRAGFARHAQQVRAHMSLLAGKGYWEQVAKSPELVVMFIPGESFVAAALEADGALIEDGITRGIVIATPATLVALLRAIAFGWRQERIAESARTIGELGKQLYDRIRTLGQHFEKVGGALGAAVGAYNQAVGSMESRVLPAARRFRELELVPGEEIRVLEPLALEPRRIAAPETPPPLDGSTGEAGVIPPVRSS